MEAMFLKLSLDMPPLPDITDLSSEEVLAIWQDRVDHYFTFQAGGYVPHSSLRVPDGAEMQVTGGIFFGAKQSLFGYGPLQSLGELVDRISFPKPATAAKTKQATSSAASASDVLAEHPWLAEYLKHDAPNAGQANASNIDATAQPLEEEPGNPVDRVWAAILEQQRREQHENTPYAGDDFTTCLKSQYIGPEVWESDRVIAQAKHGSASVFCNLYKLSKTASFSYSRYLETGSLKLALEWCRRMQFLYNIWQDQSTARYVFTAVDLAGYRPTLEWESFVASLPASGHLRDRALIVQSITPSHP